MPARSRSSVTRSSPASRNERYADAGVGTTPAPICFDARRLEKGDPVANAELAGTVPLWQWIGDEGATTFSH